MPSATPIYDEARKLALDLRNEKQVRKRRDLGRRLHQLLSDDTNLRKLKVEATPRRTGPDDLSAGAQRCIKLSQLWTMVLMGAISVAQSITVGKSKAKRTIDDIELPFKLLLSCIKPGDAFENEGLAIPRVNKKTLRSLLNYCLNLLGEEDIADEVETKMLEMLNFLCSNEHFVANFKHTSDFRNIMAELRERLTPEVEQASMHCFNLAAKAISSLFNSGRRLGIDLQLFVPDTLEMISEWCKQHIYEDMVEHLSPALLHFYTLASCILDCYPDVSIGPMKRHGRPILSYSKRCYAAASGPNKQALNDYLFSHLLLSQFTGKMEGLAPGDLGDLGKASISDRQLADILELVLNDLDKLATSSENSRTRLQSKHRRDWIWKPNDFCQPKHLQVGSRLMACAQRLFLSKVGWDSIGEDNLVDNLLDELIVPGPWEGGWVDSDIGKEKDVPASMWKESPWMKRVAKALLRGIDSNDLATLCSNAYAGFGSREAREMLDLQITELDAMDPGPSMSLLSGLAIISSCAKTFPGGECWSSIVFSNWQRLALEDPNNLEVAYYSLCAPDNLTFIVLLLGIRLEYHGAPQGDMQIQCWILHALRCLTESSAIVYQHFHHEADKIMRLGYAWRRVWNVLFLSDLGYQAATEVTAVDSVGDLVLSLVRDMVERRCTDPPISSGGTSVVRQASFVFENQKDIWNLPVFKRPQANQSGSLYELICVTLSEAGLSGKEHDDIAYDASMNSLSSTQPGNSVQTGPLSRRRRLISFVLCCLEQTIKSRDPRIDSDTTIHHSTALAVICILALVGGRGPPHFVDFEELDGPSYRRIPKLRGMEKVFKAYFAPLDILRSAMKCESESFLSGLFNSEAMELAEMGIRSLWGSIDLQLTPSCVDPSPHHDFPRALASTICEEHALKRKLGSDYADFVSYADAADHRDFVLCFIRQRLHSLRPAESDAENYERPLTETLDTSVPTLTPNTISESLYYRVASVKVELSVLMWCHKVPIQANFRPILLNAIHFIETSCSALLRTHQHREFLDASAGLVQISRALADISCTFQIGLDEEKVKCAAGTCKSLLDAYAVRKRNFTTIPVKPPGTPDEKLSQAGSTDDFMDDELEGGEDKFRKERLYSTGSADDESDSERGRKKRKHLSDFDEGVDHKRLRNDDIAAVLSLDAVQHVARLLLMFDPSPANAQFICETLLGTELDLDPDTVNGDMDLRPAAFCASLLNQPEVFLYQLDKQHESVEFFDMSSQSQSSDISIAEIFCRVVELVRACAGPSSPLQFFGGHEIVPLVHWNTRLDYGYEASKDESRRFVEILHFVEGVASRPLQRASRLRACTAAFVGGNEIFHGEFDKSFTTAARESLKDTCSIVRCSAHEAVGAAIGFLDEQSIYSSVEKSLAPISHPTAEEGSRFQIWYQNSPFCHIEDETTSPGGNAADVQFVMEFDSIRCRSTIAARAKNEALVAEQLFEIVMVATKRPSLEFVCFQALERTAALRGYSCLEDMITYESERMASLWLQSEALELPLVLTAPSLLRAMVYRGTSGRKLSRHEGSMRDCHAKIVREASEHFVERYCHVLVPLALFRCLARAPTSLDIGRNRDHDIKLLVGDSKLQTLCSLRFSKENSEKNISILLKKHLPDIHGFCLPILKWDEARYRSSVCSKMFAILDSILSAEAVENQSSKNVNLIVRGIFNMSSKSELLPGFLPVSDETYFEALLGVIQKTSKSKFASGDLLMAVGTSATEVLLWGAVQLLDSNLQLQQQRSWFAVKLQCQLLSYQLKNRNHNNIQLGFCIHVLTQAILKMDRSSVRSLIFPVLIKILKDALAYLDRECLRQELTPVVQRLIGACLHIHEESQKTFLRKCRRRYAEFEAISWRSSGLIGEENSSHEPGAWGWEADADFKGNANLKKESLDRYGLRVKDGIRDGIVCTFEVMQWIFDNLSALEVDSRLLSCAGPPYSVAGAEHDMLCRYDARFSAQHLALTFVQGLGHSWDDIQTDTEFLVEGLMTLLSDRQAWMNKILPRSPRRQAFTVETSLSSLNADQRLLFSAIAQLERAFREAQATGQEFSSVPRATMERLIRELSFVCGAFCPQELRVAASRCLGEIETTVVAELSLIQASHVEFEWLEKAVDEGVLLVTMQAKCVESLAKSLKSAEPRVALTAAETLKSILGGSDAHCWSILKDTSSRGVLAPFLDKSHGFVQRIVPLGDHELKALQAKCGLEDDEFHSAAWCWNVKIWQCIESKHSFENWICSVTTAIIVCCYSNPADGLPSATASKNHHHFLSLCQRICFLEHEFCVSIFPYLVAVLLDDEGNSSDHETADRLSASFSALIDDPGTGSDISTGRVNTKAISLVIDTLDVLRRISQRRFLLRNHKRNRIALSGRNYDIPVQARKKSPGKKHDKKGHNVGLPANPRWRGVPFGITLRINGIILVRACIQARKFASALFFLEDYLNAKLGRSSDIFDLISDHAMGKTGFAASSGAGDISGTVRETESTKDPPNAGDRFHKAILPVMTLLSKCFEELHAFENMEVTNSHQAAIDFLGSDSNNYDAQMHTDDAIDMLRQLDNPVLGIEATHLSTLDCMEELGMHRVLQTYIDGLGCDRSLNISQNSMSKLREAWFRSYLCKARWETLSDVDSYNQMQGFLANHPYSISLPAAQADNAAKEMGFFESMSKAFHAFCSDNMESCQHLLLQARLSTLDSTSEAGVGESPLVGIVGHIEKLKAIHDLATLTKGQVGMSKICRALGVEELGAGIGGVTCSRRASHISLMLEGSTVNEFSCKMPELIVRSLLMKKLPGLQRDLSNLLVSHLWQTACQARSRRRPFIAQEAIQRLRKFLGSNVKDPIESIPSDELLNICIEEAFVLECRGDFKQAIRKSGQIIDLLVQREAKTGGLDEQLDCLLAEAQINCGRWMAKYKVREAAEVLTNYLLPGTDRARRISSARECKENAQRSTMGFLEVAKMVSNLYDVLFARTQTLEYKQNSSSLLLQEQEVERCDKLIEKKRRVARTSGSQAKKSDKEFHDLQMYHHTLKKDTERKRSLKAKLEASLAEYLNEAIKSFGTALSMAGTDQTDDMSKYVFRMTSLWFSGSSGPVQSSAVNNHMATWVQEIPSFRFIPLTNQLFARIELASSGDDKGFQTTLHTLVSRMSTDHPYHTIVHLLALSNAKKVGSGVSGRNAGAFLENVGDSKVQGAEDILAQLSKNGPEYMEGLVSSYSRLVNAYNDLANASTDAFHGKETKNIPFSKIFRRSGQALDTVDTSGSPPCVFTAPPPIQADADYGAGIEDPVGAERVKGFETYFHITETGLHRPKIVICRGSRGGRFRQLVKGEDEIRQDAIMSQIFDYVNRVVARQSMEGQRDSKQTRTRRIREQLRMVTYNVVPLSPASGVLEWVEDTIPFGDYILDKRQTDRSYEIGAHSRYYPGEWGCSLCRLHLAKSPDHERRQSFDEICLRFSPVFRFFFVERFGHSMQLWHAARMKFTRSVAVSSIVGHILGIGDRHTSNILVHQKTGEVVHIDFGIVFEQGKLLNTPERVPFRLTNNMVDGMGPCGTEGAFVSAAEETTRVLRSNASDLLTILSAVVADPLYKWTMSPVEAARRQTSNEGEVKARDGEGVLPVEGTGTAEDENRAGAVVLSKIKEKLQGYEDSTSGEQQGIESQVTFLINAARDPDNLCEMFPGWGSWI